MKFKSFTWKWKSKVLFGEITEIIESNEKFSICRYTSPALKGLYEPLIKFDLIRKKVHFLDEASFTGETNFPQFDPKGRNCNFFN